MLIRPPLADSSTALPCGAFDCDRLRSSLLTSSFKGCVRGFERGFYISREDFLSKMRRGDELHETVGAEKLKHCRHVDLNGHEFPFSRGVSFYEINDEGKIVAARDCVEPALKPGSSALQVRQSQDSRVLRFSQASSMPTYAALETALRRDLPLVVMCMLF